MFNQNPISKEIISIVFVEYAFNFSLSCVPLCVCMYVCVYVLSCRSYVCIFVRQREFWHWIIWESQAEDNKLKTLMLPDFYNGATGLPFSTEKKNLSEADYAWPILYIQ